MLQRSACLPFNTQLSILTVLLDYRNADLLCRRAPPCLIVPPSDFNIRWSPAIRLLSVSILHHIRLAAHRLCSKARIPSMSLAAGYRLHKDDPDSSHVLSFPSPRAFVMAVHATEKTACTSTRDSSVTVFQRADGKCIHETMFQYSHAYSRCLAVVLEKYHTGWQLSVIDRKEEEMRVRSGSRST